MGTVTGKAWTDYSEPRIMAADLEAIEAGIVQAQATADGKPDTTDGFATVDKIITNTRTLPQVVLTTGQAQTPDGAGLVFRTSSVEPTQRVNSRIAFQSNSGQWVTPANLPVATASQYDSRAVADILKLAESYVDAGSALVYDSSRPSALASSTPVHSSTTAPYPITCSAFTGLVLSGVAYDTSTYVADANTKKYGWGFDFGVPGNTQLPWQAHKQLLWFYRAGMAMVVDDRRTELMPGDVLYFSQRDPEGSPYNNGRFFMNVYHVGIYAGLEGGVEQIIHAYSPASGNGVRKTALATSLRDDLTFIVRPAYQRPARSGAITVTPNPERLSGTIAARYSDDWGIVTLDNTQLATALQATMAVGAVPIGAPQDVSAALVSSGGKYVRATIGTSGNIRLYAPVSVPSGETLYGSIVFPTA